MRPPRIVDDRGLRVAVIPADAAAEPRDWAREDVDVVRVPRPDPAAWAALEERGFIAKPEYVTWLAAVGGDDEEFLERMGARERRKVRAATREVGARGVRLDVVSPLDAATLEEFLVLYEAHIAGLRNGIPFARQARDELLARSGEYFAVCATDADGHLIGGGICADDADDAEGGVVRLRFTALAAAERQGRLVRALYLRACREARERGRALFSLGTDPNLYGHIAQPGLFVFKSKLGFAPVPAHSLDPEDGGDVADLVVRLDALTDPSLVIAYAGDWAGHRPEGDGPVTATLRLDVLTGGGQVDLSPYRAPFLAGVRTRVVPR